MLAFREHAGRHVAHVLMLSFARTYNPTATAAFVPVERQRAFCLFLIESGFNVQYIFNDIRTGP